MARKFSERYRRSIWIGFIWALLLALWCCLVLDMGESAAVFVCSVGGYCTLVLLTMFRRPSTPTSLDLLLVGWSLPILFLGGLALYPLAVHLFRFD